MAINKKLRETVFNKFGGRCAYCGCEITIATMQVDHYLSQYNFTLWLRDKTMLYFGVHYFDFYNYAIIDDDSDMLLNQRAHFFQIDNYSGLTPNTCYKIKRFFTRTTFENLST